MPLGLVPRSARAFAAHLNSIYRVFKGIDADSVAVRLNTGGAFEVRNSVTNLPVFKVTDDGLEGLIGTEDILDSAVTSAKIADGSIVNADVNPTAGIVVTKSAHVGAGNVLKSTGAANIGAQVVDADVAGGAAIGLAKLFHVGANNVVRSNGSTNVAGQVVNADVAPAAAVVVSKLAAGGTANRVVATADGTTMAMQQVVGNMIADGTITSAKLSGGIPVPAGSITTTEIADGTIMDVDINAAAAIAVSKLAAGSTWVALGRLVASGGATTGFNWQSIPATYRSLVIDWEARTPSAGTATLELLLQIGFANVLLTSAGYDTSRGQFLGTGSFPAEFVSVTAWYVGYAPLAGTGANYTGTGQILVPNYAVATWNKHMRGQSVSYTSAAAAGGPSTVFTNIWGGNVGGLVGTINRRQLTLNAGGVFANGSEATLYGVPA